MSFRHPIIAALVALLLALSGGPSTFAQPAPPAEAVAAPATDLEAFVKTIENERERADFLAKLRAMIAAEKQQRKAAEGPTIAGRLLADISQRVDAAARELVIAANTLLDVPSLSRWIQEQIATPDRRSAWLVATIKLLAIFTVALLAEWVMRAILRRPRSRVEDRMVDGLWARAVVLAARTVLDLLPIIAFAAVGYGALAVADPAPAARIVALALLNASVITRAALATGRLILVPEASSLRLLPIDDEAAAYAYVWLRRLTYTAVYGYFALGLLSVAGLAPQAHGVLVRLVGLAFALLAAMIVLQNREPVARLIAGGETAAFGLVRRRIADVWHVLGVAYVVGVYLVWALRIRDGFEFLLRATLLTILLLIVTGFAGIAIRRLIARGFSLRDEVKERFPGIEARANRYLPLLQGVARALIILIGVLAILDVWGVGIFGWLSGPIGRELLGRVVTIGAIVLVALVVWEGASAMIERYLRSEAEVENPVAYRRRLRTLLPLLRNVLTVVLGVLVALTVLAEVGVDTGPLIAGAGILGLAIGFGAQSLVKDVITGFFIVLEDSMAVGDVVTIAGQTGVVEEMSIRSIQLRDVEGIVRRIPSSEVTSVVNMTKEFSYAVFDIGVAYREDVDEVIAVMREVGGRLRENPGYAVDILEDIEVLGLDQFADSAVIVRGRIKTRPIKQWRVKREYNRMLKKRFDELGIEMPFPHQTIYFGEDKSGKAPPAYVRLKHPPESAEPD